MKVIIKHLKTTLEFVDKELISLGTAPSSDFCLSNVTEDISLKLLFVPKYKKYILINSNENQNVLCDGNNFSKTFVNQSFAISFKNIASQVLVQIDYGVQQDNLSKINTQNSQSKSVGTQTVSAKTDTSTDFDEKIELARVHIMHEIGASIIELKNNIFSNSIYLFLLNAAMLLLSLVCSFGITNFLLGFKIENNSSNLNLTTNMGFLIFATLVTLTISFTMKQGIYLLMKKNNSTNSIKISDSPYIFLIAIASIDFFVIYVINFLYYKSIPYFAIISFFIALLFVGALVSVAIASGYVQYQLEFNKNKLINLEYRADFEATMRSYRKLIANFVNNLSENKLNIIKSSLLNWQLRSIVEIFVGILTAPFLAYGVSNTLAGCFPEAANWVRISGLRFSPIFLVLSTFLIIFAFFSFVRAFTISKQINGSEIIKFDGFNDFVHHGLSIFGVDALKSLNREKTITLCIACFIIIIEFTMNVSYFISEIGSDVQGFFLCCITALVPTALLIAETTLLSATSYKINNYNQLLSMVV